MIQFVFFSNDLLRGNGNRWLIFALLSEFPFTLTFLFDRTQTCVVNHGKVSLANRETQERLSSCTSVCVSPLGLNTDTLWLRITNDPYTSNVHSNHVWLLQRFCTNRIHSSGSTSNNPDWFTKRVYSIITQVLHPSSKCFLWGFYQVDPSPDLKRFYVSHHQLSVNATCVTFCKPSLFLHHSHPVSANTWRRPFRHVGPLLWKDVYGNLSDVAAFQQQLWSQGKRHVASQECGGTVVSQPPNRKDSRPQGRRPEESLQKIAFFVCLFLNLNFMHAYRLTQESNV